MNHSTSDAHVHEEIQSDSFIWLSLWLLMSLILGIAGNSLLVAVILRKGKFRNVSNVFNLNLAAADFIRAVVFTPVYLEYARTKSWPLGFVGCRLMYVALYSTFGVTVLTLVCLSWDRYKATVHPLKKQMTVRTALWLVLITWLVAMPSSFIGGYPALQLATKTSSGRVICVISAGETTVKALVTSSLLVTQFLPATFFIVTYVKIILKLRKDVVSIRPSERTQNDINRFQRNKKAVRILLLEIFLFMVFLYPFHQFNITEVFNHGGLESPLTVRSVATYCMMVAYSSVNPILHLVLNSEFRKELRKLVDQARKCCSKAT